ncbi:hypothetical protein BN946_scf184759.g15 [Trametes cinnabarina]|uniref:Uncharacterized protein n=1 Tax=Pycnoporus cinnabarinus TaxID=5643 RepID=A0A060S5E8_PYCCI|nr:hypothetical protein BN946_scf184759.g15 [Trametes cinnabarina]
MSGSSSSSKSYTDLLIFAVILAFLLVQYYSAFFSINFASLALHPLSTEARWAISLATTAGRFLAYYGPFLVGGTCILGPVFLAGFVTASTCRTASASAPSPKAQTAIPSQAAASTLIQPAPSPLSTAQPSTQSQSPSSCLIRRILAGTSRVALDPVLVADFKKKIQDLSHACKQWKETSETLEARARTSEASHRQTHRILLCKELALAQKERRVEELRIMLVILKAQEQNVMADLQIQLRQARSEQFAMQTELRDARSQLKDVKADLEDAQATLEATRARQSDVERDCFSLCERMAAERDRAQRQARRSAQASREGGDPDAALRDAKAALEAKKAAFEDIQRKITLAAGQILELKQANDRAMAERDEHKANAQLYASESERLQYTNIELEHKITHLSHENAHYRLISQNLLTELEGYRAMFAKQEQQRYAREQELSAGAETDHSGKSLPDRNEPAPSACAFPTVAVVDVPTVLITSPSSQWCVRHIVEYYDDTRLCPDNVVYGLETMGSGYPLPLPSELPPAEPGPSANEVLACRRRTHHNIRTAPTPLDCEYEEELAVEEYLEHETDYSPADTGAYSSPWLYYSRIPVLKRQVHSTPPPVQPEPATLKAVHPSAIPRLKCSVRPDQKFKYATEAAIATSSNVSRRTQAKRTSAR